MVLGLQGAFSFFFLFLSLYSVSFWRNYQYSWNNNALDGLYRLHLNAILISPDLVMYTVARTLLWLGGLAPYTQVPWVSRLFAFLGFSWLSPNTNSGESR